MDKNGLRYSFESTNLADPAKKYQVRLNGEFVMYSPKHDSSLVDKLLEDYGFTSREETLDFLIKNR